MAKDEKISKPDENENISQENEPKPETIQLEK